MTAPKNRLADETSPYLKQHETNPVDWYPWGEEALARARQENKPILLSVGYSACHWCHVMAHESFENPQIAALMNENFVNVKVDREERPDLDHLYQNVAQAMTGGGGWPLTVFLTPDLRPFFGGTYFPPTDRYGRPGFGRLLQALARAYREEPDTVDENAGKLTSIIAQLEGEERVRTSGESLTDVTMIAPSELQAATERLLAGFDWTHGGMGSAPKFPNPMSLQLFWRMGGVETLPKEFRASARTAAVLALTKMARGGIFDQLGGGFHRYSVDERWAVPHFEKMLYDNGLLLQLYSEVLLTAPRDLLPEETRALFLGTIQATAIWVMREMQSSAGGYYAAQDADSEGEEGKYFVWDPEELAAVLSRDETRAFSLRYGVEAAGNFEHGKTVLFQARSLEEVSQEIRESLSVTRKLVEEARSKLFTVREKRVKPGLDDKVLVSWNGLMVSGMAWAALALEAGECQALAVRVRESARRAYAFVKRVATTEPGRLSATIQGVKGPEGRAKGNGYLDDYAFLARGALDLARVATDETQGLAYAKDAAAWMRTVMKHFADAEGPGYFFTSDDHERLLTRPKTLSDQAIPSGTGVALGAMAFLAEIDPEANRDFESEWRSQLGRLAETAPKNPFGMGEILLATLSARIGVAVLKTADEKFSPELAAHPYAILFSRSQAGLAPGQWQLCRRSACTLFSDARAALSELKV